ncbi:MAG: TonB-dependent receptor, partial [Bryobacteraceae bacterium]|nr:TonB-dependent receptor [Bryobacteraceae bacterium]
MSHHFPAISPWTAAILLIPAALFAQSTSGTITGQITDPGGAAVAGAPIEARDTARNQVLRTESSPTGSYSVSGLSPGIYEVKVTVTGFKAAIATTVEVRVAQTTTQNFSLELGQVSESVSVSGEAPLINPNSAAVTTTVQNQLLQDLPFNDRSALSAVLLTPGSQGDPQYNGGVQSEMPAVFTQAVSPGGSLTMGGGRPGGGSILVDGSDVMSAGNARAVITFSADTVQEVSVQANGIPAQYGRTTGGIINQATKSGSNQYHGNFTWSHTDPGLQTRFLGSSFGPTARYDTYTGAIGGPVIIPKIYNGRNKTFFWASGEPQRQSLRIGASRVRLPNANVLAGKFRDEYEFLDPTLRARDINAAIASPIRTNGVYYRYNLNNQGFPVGPQLANSAWTAIPNGDLSRQLAANPLAQNLLKTLYPFTPGQNTPNITWLRPDGLSDIDGNNAIFVRGVASEDNRYSFKIDQLLGASDRIAFRYSVTPVQGVRFDWGGPSDPGGPIVQDRVTSYNTGLQYNKLISPTLANETRVTYSRGDAFRGPNDAAASQDWGPTLGLLPAVAGVGFPQILGRGANGEGRTLDVNFGMGTDFSLQKGAHSLRVGGEHRRIQLNRISYSGLTGGSYSFSGQVNPPTGSMNDNSAQVAGLILGALNSYSFQRFQSNAYYRWRYWALYLQDDWKLNSKLTLNLGLRWDYETPRTEKYDRQGWFDPTVAGTVNSRPVAGAFVFANTGDRQRGLFPSNFSGLQPRIGLAYQLRSNIVWRSSFSVLRAPLTGYGNSLSSSMSSSKPLDFATRAAMRDAAAKFLTQFPEQAIAKELGSGRPLVAAAN